jgi:hypothetical protein
VGTKKHLIWISEKLGSLAYTNPSLVLAKSESLMGAAADVEGKEYGRQGSPQTSDFMRILCPECKCQLNIQL